MSGKMSKLKSLENKIKELRELILRADYIGREIKYVIKNKNVTGVTGDYNNKPSLVLSFKKS